MADHCPSVSGPTKIQRELSSYHGHSHRLLPQGRTTSSLLNLACTAEISHRSWDSGSCSVVPSFPSKATAGGKKKVTDYRKTIQNSLNFQSAHPNLTGEKGHLCEERQQEEKVECHSIRERTAHPSSVSRTPLGWGVSEPPSIRVPQSHCQYQSKFIIY